MKMLNNLETEIGEKLRKLDFIEIDGSLHHGYAVDEAGNVTGLNLDKLNLQHLPQSLAAFSHLEKLSLFDNELIDLSLLQKMTGLTALGLGENKLMDITPLRNLTRLTIVELESNQLTDISALQGLHRLDILGLDDNQLTDISALRELKQLTALYLADNKVTDLTPLQGLSQLDILYLRNNQVQDMTSVLGLKKLTLVDLMENEIRRLPAGIVDMGLEIDIGSRYHCGEGIFLYGNPLAVPDPGIIEEGNEAIRDYFKSLKNR